MSTSKRLTTPNAVSARNLAKRNPSAFGAIVSTLLSVSSASTAAAQRDIAPAMMQLHGYLTDSAGQPITGEREVEVRLYGAVDQPIETAEFHERHTVQVNEGFFVLPVGALNPVGIEQLGAGVTHLGLQIVNEEEMQPRFALSSVPYARYADRAGSVEWGNILDKPVLSTPEGPSIRPGDTIKPDSDTWDVNFERVQARATGECSRGHYAVGIRENGAMICRQLTGATSRLAELGTAYGGHWLCITGRDGVTYKEQNLQPVHDGDRFHFCALAAMRVGETDHNDEDVQCDVFPRDNRWRIAALLPSPFPEGGAVRAGDQVACCRANCMAINSVSRIE